MVFDPKRVSYSELLNVYWHDTDPTDAYGQFCDHGDEYKSVIFYASSEQKKLAERSREELSKSKVLKAPIVTELRPVQKFFAAEARHQEYHLNYHENYIRYRQGCRRDETLEKVWGRSGN